MRRFTVILFAWLITTGVGFSQCAMCKQALTKSDEGQRLISGMNTGILFLLAMPFVLVGALTLLLLRAHMRRGGKIPLPGWLLKLRAAIPGKQVVHAYVELLKPRIVAMVLVTTAIGFFLGGNGSHSVWLLFVTLAGIGCTAGGAAVLNHYIERDQDAMMDRTRNRPLPSGLIAPGHAFAYGVILVLLGIVISAWGTNLLSAFLSLLAAFLYVLVYTPLKRVTWFNTTIGAIPGAIPPMCGWAAASGRLDAGAWILFLLLFIWQHPHFYALAWMFRDDYRKAGFQMLPVVDPTGKRTFRQILLTSVLLLAVSLVPTLLGMTSWIYTIGAFGMGAALIVMGSLLLASKSSELARRIFLGSLVYLPALSILLILDHSLG